MRRATERARHVHMRTRLRLRARLAGAPTYLRPVLAAAVLAAAVLGACTGGSRDAAPTTAAPSAQAPSDANRISTHRSGQVGPGGGYVFYVSPDPFPCGPELLDLCNHLEAAPFAAELVLPWEDAVSGGHDASAGELALDVDIGTGARNTAAIVSRSGERATAAAYAESYEHGGKPDWYLPSLDELHELTIYRELVGGFTFGVYWSSTERDVDSAWYQHFMNSFQFPDKKTRTYVVRPVRAF